MSAVLAIGWNPEIRGVIVVLIGVVVLMGSVYLLLATNVGLRLGFLIAFAALFGWLASMGLIWWSYGIGLKGREASWQPAQPFTIIRSAADLDNAELIETQIPVVDPRDFPAEAVLASQALQDNGWTLLPEDNQGRGQAIAAADAIIQTKAELYKLGEYQAVGVFDMGGNRWPKINDTLDFLAFRHEPHYALVEIAPLVPQRDEPGRAPAAPKIDKSQPHQYVLMERDLGSRRQPATVITFGSSLIFALCCYLLHRRDKIVAVNRGTAPAKA